MMVFDTDILIWHFRGNKKATLLIDNTKKRAVSIITYMELLYGARDKSELKLIKTFIKDLGFTTIPITENISLKAGVLLEEFCLNIKISIPDAIIAATAIDNMIPLCTGNIKHFKQINSLDLQIFKP